MMVPAVQCILRSEWICLNLIKSVSVFLTHPSCRQGCSTQQLSQDLSMPVQFSEEIRSQLGQQENPPGRVLGSHTEEPRFGIT